MNPTSLLPITESAFPGLAEPSPAAGFGELIARFILGNGQAPADDAGTPLEDGAGAAGDSLASDDSLPGHSSPEGDLVDTAALLALLPAPAAPATGAEVPDSETHPSESVLNALPIVGPRASNEPSGIAPPAHPISAPGQDSSAEGATTADATSANPALPSEASDVDTDPAAGPPVAGAPVGRSFGAMVDAGPKEAASPEPVEAASRPSVQSTAGGGDEPAPEMVAVRGGGPGPAASADLPNASRAAAPASGTPTADAGAPGPATAQPGVPTTAATSSNWTRRDGAGRAPGSADQDGPVVEGAGNPVAGMRLDSAPVRSIEIPPSLVRRVEQAIQMVEHAPPPRRITIEADELNGLRLTVSVRPDGIAVTSPTADAGTMDAIEQALRARGFDLSDSGRRRDQSHERYERDPWRPQPGTSPFSRPRTDQGIRL